MSTLVLNNVQMAYGALDVLFGVSAELPEGARVGLVGPNGGGKSTLMRVIAGMDTPTGGTIAKARGDRMAYVAQEPLLVPGRTVFEEALAARAELLAMEQELHAAADAVAETTGAEHERAQARYAELEIAFERAGGYTFEADAKRVLHGLGLTESFWPRRAGDLSGGERARLGLAQALLQDPDILLLDEPTNHLDLESLAWLEGMLAARRGTLVVVSHDRYFLDRVATTIWELRAGRVTVFRGNYSHYEVQRRERDALQQQMYERQREEIARQEEYIRRNKAGQNARQAKGRQTRLDRVERIEAVQERHTLAINTGKAERSGRVVLRLSKVQVPHPSGSGRPIINGPEALELERGERVAVVGPNGAGKTTLLRTVLGELALLSGKVEIGASVTPAFFRQAAEDLHPYDTVLDALMERTGWLIPQARDFAARFLFSGEDVYKRIGDLSGGERSRVSLARLFSSGANFLVLDEPTNHLDLPSREALESALRGFQGTLLFVSHDRRFIDMVATHLWLVRDGHMARFAGGWTDYLNAQAAAQAAAAPVVKVAARPPEQRNGRPSTKEERRLEARVRELERQVTEAEQEVADLTAQLERASEAADVPRITDLSLKLQTAEGRLTALMEAWEEAATAVAS